MSWHRFRLMHYDDDCIGEKFTCRRIGPRKGVLKKPCAKFVCKRYDNNNIFPAFTKCRENENEKVCTFKPCEPSPVLSPCCNGDRTRNKRLNTDCVLVPEPDFRISKKRTRFTEAARVRSPCSILSLKSKHCCGNPYISYCPKHSGECDCQHKEAEASRTDTRQNKNRRKNISTDGCTGFFYKPCCNKSTIYKPDLTTCANDLPCISDKAPVRKCTKTCVKKKLKNEKTGGDACMCYVDASTSTNGKSRWGKKIKPRRRDCCPYDLNPKYCANYEDPCCKSYVDEETNTKHKSCCLKVRPRICDEFQATNCCQNTCPDPCVDLVDEATDTHDKTGCLRIPDCEIRARIPECQKLTPICPEYQNLKCNKMCETCDEPPECYRYQISTPGISKCPSCELNKIRWHTGTDYCQFFEDSATDTRKRPGCYKVIRPRLRECRKPKWYEKLKKKSCVGFDYYKDASTSTKPKSRCSKLKVIRPRVHECEYSRWNCFRKSEPCTCCEDNAQMCKCREFKWKQIFRRKCKPCPENDCKRIRNPCLRLEDKCGRVVLPVYDVSEQCINNNCQTALTKAREIMIESTALTTRRSKLFLGPSKCRGKFSFPCSTEETCQEDCVYPNSCRPNCGVATSPSLLQALLHKRNPCAKPCEKCYKQCGTQKCLRCKLSNCFERLMICTVSLCCAPCFLIAISYWFICYLFTSDCTRKKADKCYQTPNCRDAPCFATHPRQLVVQGENFNRIQRNCLDPCSPCCSNDNEIYVYNATPEYKVEMYNNQATNTGCLPNPCTNNSVSCNDEGKICKKNNKIRISKRCGKKSCPNPQRKYNLYYVDDRGWVIKPIPDGACGGGDNNLNPDTCSSPKRTICDKVKYDPCCNSTGPNVCSPQKILACKRLNYEDPCCKSRDNDERECPPEKIFCERVNYTCDYEDNDKPFCPPHETFCDTEIHNSCINNADPERVCCEGANSQEACSPDLNCAPKNRLFCEKGNFQDPCACYYCTNCTDRRERCCQPWRPNKRCICLSDCECPKISFWKWIFCKSRRGNQYQIRGNEYQQSNNSIKKGNFYQRTKIRNINQKASRYQKVKKYQKSIRSMRSWCKPVYAMGGTHSQYKVGKRFQMFNMEKHGFWFKFDRADKKFSSETKAVCEEMVKDIVKLQPSMKQTFYDLSRSLCRFLRYILVSCCCCPVFCCFYCCHVCCYRMYCRCCC